MMMMFTDCIFKCQKMFGDTDFSEFDIQINFVNAAGNGDVYKVIDKEISDDVIIFSWLLDKIVFEKAGDVMFGVSLKLIDENNIIQKEFNTTIATLPPVLKGLYAFNIIQESYPSTLEDILKILSEIPLALADG